MSMRGKPIPPPRANRRPPNELPQAVADRRNQQMTDILRLAAEARDKRERERASQDDTANRTESAALLALAASHARSQEHAQAPDTTGADARSDEAGAASAAPTKARKGTST